MTRTVVRGGTVVTPDRTLSNHAVVVDGQRIMAVAPAGEVPPGGLEVDASGGYVIPGLIDVHVHGGDGHDVMDATTEALAALSTHLARHGVTSFLATTVTHTTEATDAAIDAVRQAGRVPGARLLGVHLEGPYLSFEHRGAQNPAHLRPPDPAEYDRWFAGGMARLMTVAPEIAGFTDLLNRATEDGVRLAVGHSGASYDDVRAAFDAGVRHATHTFNGMAPMHHRDPGVVGAVLSDDRIFAEVIADGHHVHPAIIRLLVRAKGADRTLLVSDGIRATGLPDGSYALGDQDVTVREGVCRTAEGGLAGSTLTLDRAIANVVSRMDVSLPDAVRMATTTPAAAIGAQDVGELAAGRRADITILDRDLRVRVTIVDGRIVHQRERTAG